MEKVRNSYEMTTDEYRSPKNYKIVGKDIRSALSNYFEDHNWLYDADTCGYERIHCKVRNLDGQIEYWVVEHSWYIDYESEWEMHNEFDYMPWSKDYDSTIDGKPHEFDWSKIPDPGRDWLII